MHVCQRCPKSNMYLIQPLPLACILINEFYSHHIFTALLTIGTYVASPLNYFFIFAL